MTDHNRKKIIESITRLLARREHSVVELTQKLTQKGFESDVVGPVIQEFQQANIQSDKRFAESRVRHAADKGMGPNRIRGELAQHQIDESYIIEAFAEVDVDWFELAKKVHAKKYASRQGDSFKEKQKQRQFLQYRGFSLEHIQYAMEDTGSR